MAGRDTPVMRQFHSAKRAYPDSILFFRLGDFYEMFEDDAVICARLLDLTLTSRNKGKPDEVPMAGVPHHAAHSYVARLLELGHKVAVCEQMADPSKTKGIVPREVVRVLTPGTITDRDQLDASTNNWLAAIELGTAEVAIALLDLSTGELSAAELPDLAALLGALSRAAPKEVLVGGRLGEQESDPLPTMGKVLRGAAVRADTDIADTETEEVLGALSRDAARLSATARRAVARAVRYAAVCTPGSPLPVRRIGAWDPSAALVIDPIAQAHLELVASMTGERKATLLGVIDSSNTPMGARLLRRRMLAPLTEVDRIRRRLDAVELFVIDSPARQELRAELVAVGDLERLGVRAALREATPRDLGALRDGLLASRKVVALLNRTTDLEARRTLGLHLEKNGRDVVTGGDVVDTVDDVADVLARALLDRPPAHAKDGAVFQPDYDGELEALAQLKKSGTEQIVALEAELRTQTGITNLRAKHTKVFGWYVEVSRSHISKAPKEWRRKQTVAAGERFTLDELDELADRIANAEEKHREREHELLAELAELTARASERIADLAARVARWDVSASLAEVAHRYDYTRPEVDDSGQIVVTEGRHPGVERLAAAGRFVPNDVRLDIGNERLWLVTGPNMAGKSTLLRQVALTAVLAQMGSYVPARGARIGVVDRVLSRVGASDNLAAGESTFMVEMRETAAILRYATERSLVILDEIGRGTSTFDGLAIAWAVAEHLDDAVRCRALFATHYHELTALADDSKHVANYSVSAREYEDDVVFLHRVVPGPASRSYGVAVAKLAGLPESVLARAKALLTMLESDGGRGRGAKQAPENQLALFENGPGESPETRDVVETLRATDVDRLTPIDALTLIARLKKKL